MLYLLFNKHHAKIGSNNEVIDKVYKVWRKSSHLNIIYMHTDNEQQHEY